MKRAVLFTLALVAGSCSFSANVTQFCQRSGTCICDAGSCCALSGAPCDATSPCCPGYACASGVCIIGSFDGGGNPPDGGPTPDAGSGGSDAGNDAGFLCALPDAGCSLGTDCCTQSCSAAVCACSPAQGTCVSDLDCCGTPSLYCDAGLCTTRQSSPQFCNNGNADCTGLASGACCYAFNAHVTCCERCPTGLANCVCQCQ